jgi:hypothetical protein
MQTDHPVEAAEAALAETFTRHRSPSAAPEGRDTPALKTIDPQTIAEPAFLAYLAYIQSRDWLYKASPPFSRRCRLGPFDCILDIRGGVIADLHIAAAGETQGAKPPDGAPQGGPADLLAGKNPDRLSAEELRDMLLGRDYEPGF